MAERAVEDGDRVKDRSRLVAFGPGPKPVGVTTSLFVLIHDKATNTYGLVQRGGIIANVELDFDA